MTIDPNPLRKPVVGPTRNLLIIGVVLGLLIVITALAMDVRNRLAALDLANSDSGQWVLMQTEVEVLRLQSTLIKAQTGETNLADVRRWFNVLYSRLRMLEQSPLYADFIQKPENLHRLKSMQSYTNRWVATIDASDDVLVASLSEIEAQSSEVQRLARALSLDSLLAFSASTDQTRARITETLMPALQRDTAAGAGQPDCGRPSSAYHRNLSRCDRRDQPWRLGGGNQSGGRGDVWP